jgi:SAM-dependent methyltransferase
MSNVNVAWEQAVLSLRADPLARALVNTCYYDDPLLDAAKRYHDSTEWAAVRKFIGNPLPGAKALDIGSGRGISAFALACDGWQAYALEPNPSSIVGAAAIRELANSSQLSINVFEEWGECLPFKDAEFDLVHCRAVLHHAHDLNALMREIKRVLKPGGIFAGIREHVVSVHADIPVFQAQHPLHNLYGGEYAYLLNEYLDAIQDSGLKITHTLNPLESEINTAPTTRLDIKRRWAGRFGLPMLARCIPNYALKVYGHMSTAPGRLYSFFAIKAF